MCVYVCVKYIYVYRYVQNINMRKDKEYYVQGWPASTKQSS